ncbi:hypothetical protein ACJX0J_040197, partial [Zea mays]
MFKLQTTEVTCIVTSDCCRQHLYMRHICEFYYDLSIKQSMFEGHEEHVCYIVEIFGQEESNTTSKIRLSYSQDMFMKIHIKFYALLQAVDCSIKEKQSMNNTNLHVCAIFTYTTNTIPGKNRTGLRLNDGDYKFIFTGVATGDLLCGHYNIRDLEINI